MTENKNILILIVEDEVKLVKAIEAQLIKSGFVVHIAVDGQEALDFCKYHTPDFILLDLLLPKVHGLEFLKKIREKPLLKNVPVMILTNLTDDNVMVEAKKLGVVGYLIKSNVKLAAIVEEIRDHFKQ